MVSKPVTSKCISRLALLISVGCGASAHPPAPTANVDLVLWNGDVRTMDPDHPHASAIAIRGDVIVAVGDREQMPPAIKLVDLGGQVVTPGLVDAHCHLYGLGADLDTVSIRALPSEQATVQAMVLAAKERPATEWLIGRGWDQNRWPGQAFPTKSSLDVISDRPVMLKRVDGHAIWVNSRGLAVAGIAAATPDPAGGKILRDAKGEPTGVLIDNATELVEAKIPAASAETRERRIRTAAKRAVEAGITGVHEMGIEDATAEVYRDLASKHELPLRVYAYLAGDPAQAEALRTRAPQPPVGLFTMRGVKFFADGALGSRGARLFDKYDDDPKNLGLWVTEPASLVKAVDAAVAGGWQVAIHAIGDAGISSVLDAYEAAEAKYPGDRRLRIEHLQVFAPKDLNRIVATHAIASMQPTHATSDMPWAEARVGKTRILGAYAWRTMLENHVPLAFGSDFPVEEVSPLLGIYAAVTRQDASGKPEGGWYPKQRLTLDEAIAAFTRGAAFAEFAESTRGVIAPGRAADLTIYSSLSADKLLDARIESTIVAGKVVYQRGSK
jgi:predicted amidohydrolase YtcJ